MRTLATIIIALLLTTGCGRGTKYRMMVRVMPQQAEEKATVRIVSSAYDGELVPRFDNAMDGFVWETDKPLWSTVVTVCSPGYETKWHGCYIDGAVSLDKIELEPCKK